jgi:mannose/cellobiose epimerase-like protein (N-acyl-D-glucosamine 2-epimerase family)
VRHALDYFAEHFVAADATVASVVDLEGKVSDPTFDLYNRALALLVYASDHGALGEEAPWRRQAVALRSALER